MYDCIFYKNSDRKPKRQILVSKVMKITKKDFNFDTVMANTDTDNGGGTWWTAPAESESGRLMMVSGRRDVDKFRNNPRFKIRVEITWPYEGDASGMPSEEESELMASVQDALTDEFRRDPVAVLTGIFTGDDERNWIFYTLSTHIFGRKLNEALEEFPQLPISIYCENDPDWQEYTEMCQAEINVD